MFNRIKILCENKIEVNECKYLLGNLFTLAKKYFLLYIRLRMKGLLENIHARVCISIEIKDILFLHLLHFPLSSTVKGYVEIHL